MDKLTTSPAPAPTANAADLGGQNVKQLPATGLKNPAEDPFLFNDPAFMNEMEALFGAKASPKAITTPKPAPQPSFNANASYHNVTDFMPPYKATADDLKAFKESADTPVAQGIDISSASYRAKRDQEWQQIMQQLDDRAAGL